MKTVFLILLPLVAAIGACGAHAHNALGAGGFIMAREATAVIRYMTEQGKAAKDANDLALYVTLPLSLSEQARNNGLEKLVIGDEGTWPVLLNGKGEVTAPGFRFPTVALTGNGNAKVQVGCSIPKAQANKAATATELREMLAAQQVASDARFQAMLDAFASGKVPGGRIEPGKRTAAERRSGVTKKDKAVDAKLAVIAADRAFEDGHGAGAALGIETTDEGGTVVKHLGAGVSGSSLPRDDS